MSKRALLVVDIQNEYFPGGNLVLSGIEQAADKAASVIAAARQHGDRVIHIRHEMTDPNTPVFQPGSRNVEIHESVQPTNGETVLLKHAPNSFVGTGLKELLDEDGIEQVVVIGAMSHMCVEATSRAAADHGYTVTVLHDACATMDLEFNGTVVPAAQVHATAMAALAFAYANLQSCDDYVG